MRRYLSIALGFLILNSAYLAAFPRPTVFYMANVLLHLGIGVALMVAAVGLVRRYPRESGAILAAGVPALVLAVAGNTLQHRWILWLHIALAVAAVVVIAARMSQARMPVLLAAALVVAAVLYPHSSPQTIANPSVAPVSMDEEGAGAKSPFAPSSAQTNTGAIIPSNFFMDSESCGQCHKDIYEQWKSSMHHFASFNNQFYRKSIEYMQDVAGTRPSKWCAGCHDHAVFFNGRFDRPIREQIDTPEAQAGLGCMSCHAIVHVGSSMGNADFTVEYPPLHELANSHNRYIRAIDYFLTYLNPKPHKQTFLKPYMESAEFCSTCHKVHLDVPVNHYRWVRGFNDYDNWQASGVSGQGARSFYYPAKSQVCADCHMPLVASRDPGNREGKVHSHRFPAANTAVAYANQDQAQMQATEDFLKSGFITVDIFSVSPAEVVGQAVSPAMHRRSDTVQANTTFAVGEEAEQSAPALIREVGNLSAPIGAADTALEAGSTARVDVVVRTRKIGHFFPGGTVDAFDVWLELEAKDADGRVIFWSGNVTGDGHGPVEPGAHFYRSYQLDEEANPINKRNAWQARSTLYVRLIPPGAADVAHYLVKVPANARGPISFTAKLNYRKFAWYYTQFAYAGQPKPGQDPSLLGENHNGLEYQFLQAGIPANVSGSIKDRIPDLPIVTLAQANASVPLGTPQWAPVVRKQDRERWNDWGIGLLLQGDLKGAEYAFRKVTEAEPEYADGWLNVARALIQEGETEAAKPFVAKALALNRELGRTWFFQAAIQKADGDYDGALQSLEVARAKYPRDRVLLNQIARILFLKREYAAAVEALKQVCAVDPEDVQMHYTLILCYRGLGDMAAAAREEALFRRFKADESSQAITERRRIISPEDNNERQAIHDHESAVKP
ncbi:Tetratricopeptide TPR_2 repeat protein [Candidatus Sulfopaludibacter sp. SbA4]|nr:Tetratricopeptide TPR_2 repeat protein [Candidatus Sulfopaludibacter sp. SbA4]